MEKNFSMSKKPMEYKIDDITDKMERVTGWYKIHYVPFDVLHCNGGHIHPNDFSDSRTIIAYLDNVEFSSTGKLFLTTESGKFIVLNWKQILSMTPIYNSKHNEEEVD